MNRVMIVVASVRPGRVGLPVARWVEAALAEMGSFEVDFVDLAELALPFMDEPNHPVKQQYTKPHTLAWSARVDAADAFIFVTPEYNHSYAPALGNAIDFLAHEWRNKPVGFVAYGGAAGGSRGVTAIEHVLTAVRLVKTGANVEIPFVATRIADGAFMPNEKESAILSTLVAELTTLTEALRPLR